MKVLKITGIIIGSIVGTMLAICVIYVLAFGTANLEAWFNRTAGVKVESSKTDMWHKSKGFTDGMVQDLSKMKLELAQTKDETARAAIIDHINEQFANFDENTIDNMDLRQFLINIRNGSIK